MIGLILILISIYAFKTLLEIQKGELGFKETKAWMLILSLCSIVYIITALIKR